MKQIEVVWLDACCEEGPVPLDAIDDMEELIRRNIGYLVREDKERITIASGVIYNFHNDKDAYEHVMIIPRAMIIETELLRGES